ncbi:hypothetical protein JRQ81_000507 [Phrynocephalus forsythii]|uniref:Uncharacterized protein n=1 Tax=Phrynocephalus forsythii TaxID=171643 RepID=A0A9Q0Y647_9SAUR|nr:hypothetical protein JRQ81_000507 [Phrynocephalus forsythii]
MTTRVAPEGGKHSQLGLPRKQRGGLSALTGSGVSTTVSAAPPRHGKQSPIPAPRGAQQPAPDGQGHGLRQPARVPVAAPPASDRPARLPACLPACLPASPLPPSLLSFRGCSRPGSPFLRQGRTAPPAAPEPEPEGGKGEGRPAGSGSRSGWEGKKGGGGGGGG